MASSLEIVEFVRPDGNRKNLYITGISGTDEETILATLHRIFSRFGPVYGVQVYPVASNNIKIVNEPDTSPLEEVTKEQVDVVIDVNKYKDNNDETSKTTLPGFYAFVTFYLATTAKKAKDELNNRIIVNSAECKISYAKRKKEGVDQVSSHLHFIKCEELANCCLGFNGWSSSIKMLECENEITETGSPRVSCMCVVKLDIIAHGLTTDGMGAWEEIYSKTDPISRGKAVCKSKKLAFQRAVENAFSRVILIVLSNGKVSVEIDTTKPEVRLVDQIRLLEEPVIKVNEICDEKADDSDDSMTLQGSQIDDINLQILQELEEDIT